MKNKFASPSAFFQPRVLFSFALLVCVALGLLLASYPGATTARAQETSVASEVTAAIPEDSERGRMEAASDDDIEAIETAKMQLELQEQDAAAQAGPLAPTVAPANDDCAGAEVIPTTLPGVISHLRYYRCDDDRGPASSRGPLHLQHGLLSERLV
jgi:hypothetical protein